MKRLATTAAFAGALVTAGLAVSPAAQATATFKSAEGITFKFFISQQLIPTFAHNLDFDDDVDTSTACLGQFAVLRACDDDDTGRIVFESRMRFTAEKGRLALSTMFEWDGAIDENVIDANDPNIERLSIKLALPEMSSTLAVGSEVLIYDTVARWVGLDDDPAIWLEGGRDNLSWIVAWTKRRENFNAGDSGGVVTGGTKGVVGDGSDHDHIFGRLNFRGATGGGTKWMLEPGAMFQNRNTADRSDQTSGYVWLGGDVTLPIVRLRGQFTYQLGEVNAGTGAGFAHDSYDISAFAYHVSAQMNTSNWAGWPLGGVAPYVTFDYSSGDDDPDDSDLEGFTPISSATALRWDQIGTLHGLIHTAMTTATGCICLNFGMETSLFGIGPTTGGIAEHARGDNPGWWKAAGGLLGRINDKWDMQAAVHHIRYVDTAVIETITGRSIDEEIGTEFSISLHYWPQKEMKMGPFFSVMFPGDGLEDVLGSDDTAMIGGINFWAAL